MKKVGKKYFNWKVMKAMINVKENSNVSNGNKKGEWHSIEIIFWLTQLTKITKIQSKLPSFF